jgi:cell wall-associated NlpC family hydrolase
VNPEPAEPPVPTNSSDPSVGADPTPVEQPAPSRRTSTPSATPAVECSPSTDGGSTTFNPGMIISDAVFYNTKSMTAAQIRTFLNTKGSSCTSQYCLRTMRFDSESKPADQYCKAYTGGKQEDVAAILQRLSVACGINPQVMLVTLQKESALVTRTDVTLNSYNAAYGWHCPDTGPGGSANCDPQYKGFFNQAYGMAKQWSRYKVNPGNYNYRAGQTTTILWNVAETKCGGSSVYIRNTATASLYNYTPYQPNAASLAAYPGVGDRCSAYGNRNFFFLFQKYFGTTGGGTNVNIGLNGVNVTLPSGPHVAPGAAGKVIVAPTAAVAKGLAAGFAAIGLPYVYGGGTAGGTADQGCARAGGASNSCKGIVGFDCSGLTAYVMKQSGYTIATYSGGQRTTGTSVAWSAGRPGDIIGYQGHVAVYLGYINGTQYLLEAPDVGMYVQVRPVYFSNGGVAVDSVLHRFWR